MIIKDASPEITTISGLCEWDRVNEVMAFIEKHTYCQSKLEFPVGAHVTYGFRSHMLFSMKMRIPTEEQNKWLKDKCRELLIESNMIEGYLP